MQFWQLLQQNSTIALLFFGLLGACIGSFLNVVIYRIPQSMLNEWRFGSVDFLKSQSDIHPELLIPIDTIIQKDRPLSLVYPASHCPDCAHSIHWYHNIPIISWLLLRGQCAYCQKPISTRYPLTELITALLSVWVVFELAVTLSTMMALILVWSLIALAGIDMQTRLLPDRLTFPLAGLGMAVNTQGWFASPTQSIWGLILGYLSLWIVVKIFYLLTKKEGMGQGDFKLLAVLGAWFGPAMLLFIIFTASLLGALFGLVLLIKRGESQPFAFGPFIVIAGIVALLYGHSAIDWYLGYY